MRPIKTNDELICKTDLFDGIRNHLNYKICSIMETNAKFTVVREIIQILFAFLSCPLLIQLVYCVKCKETTRVLI